ncbi:multidrug transporter [Agarilytica rhodophyticola]|uniref:multidrug transporter n=1 Tax=Agarilytica rhodophyticola TaxID=1737490 RepID=UPI000B344AFC|nr:multidrug transporter [Agarilytica rhodophyticola]
MLFGAFAAVNIVIALILLYLGARVAGRFKWVLAWIQGSIGLCLLAAAIVFGLSGLDLLSYKQMLQDKPILTISFKQQEEQHYVSTLMNIEDGVEKNFDVYGEQWQIDARVIRWSGLFDILGAKPGYRLERLNGRYHSLEDERRKTRSVHPLSKSEYGIDTWMLVHKTNNMIPLLEATYGSAAYLPMADGAIYQISLSHSGLVAKPMNQIAETAISSWQ